MKKVLSLVLAVMMVLGMSTMAFADFAAAPNNQTTPQDIGSFVQGATGQSATLYLPAANDTIALTGLTAITVADNDDVYTNAQAKAFFSGVTASAAASSTQLKLSFTAGSNLPAGDYDVKMTVSDGTTTVTFDSVTFTVTAKSGTTDPGTTTGTALDSKWKIVGVKTDWMEYIVWKDSKNPNNMKDDVHADETYQFALVPSMFEWEYDGTAKDPAANSTLRTSHLTNIDVRKSNPTNNSGTLKSVERDGLNIKIKTVTYFLKCGSTDVSFDLDLTYKSSASGSKQYFSFTIKNDKEIIDEGQEYVYTDGNVYVQADASVRNVEMRVGENLYITKSFGKDQKAYANVSLELSAGDEALFQKYPELSDVYTLYTVGVSSANVTVQFKDLGDTYFVYDENFKLIGTTAEKKLPFSNKYYLTTKKVDLAGTDAAATEEPADESSTSVPADTGAVGTGGGSVSAPTNYNPNTGA